MATPRNGKKSTVKPRGKTDKPNKGGKKYPGTKAIERQGIALIATWVTGLGHIWNETQVDVGIDGSIELVDPKTEESTSQTILVQSKATGFPFPAGQPVTFTCREEDLRYWLHGNAPVILVRSHPSSGEAYWKSLKDWFRDNPEERQARRIVFDRATDRLDESTEPRLWQIARSRYDGLHLGPPPVRETLFTNLLPVKKFPELFYAGPALTKSHMQTRARLRDGEAASLRAWAFNGAEIYSFHNPAETQMALVVDGPGDPIATSEWAESEDPVILRTFVQLLNGALEEQVFPAARRGQEASVLFLSAPDDLSPIDLPGRLGRTRRVVKPFMNQDDSLRHVRHLAFERRFRRYGDVWYLEIVPTYFFSRDGKEEVRYAANYLSKIKRIERHNDVKRDVESWEWILRGEVDLGGMTPDPKKQLLEFGPRVQIEIDAGAEYDQEPDEPESEFEEAEV